MKFFDRGEELDRLNRLVRRKQGGLAVVFGRRRIGKTRLLLEWTAGNRGLYTVADRAARSLAAKPVPILPSKCERCEVVRALFVPALAPGISRRGSGITLVTADDVLR